MRVGGTRVTLESVLHAYLDGESAEGVAERFPALELADVHATIAWYLRHRPEADAYLAASRSETQERRSEAERRDAPDAIRARPLARARR